MFKLSAVFCIMGMTAYSCFATEISETFTALATQVVGDGSGIFGIPATSPVYGTLTFDPAAFTPDPVGPSGSSYLNVFTGGAHSTGLSLSAGGATAALDATSSFLEVSSSLNVPWELVADSDEWSWSLLLDAPQPLNILPGGSLFDLAELGASTIELQVSDPSNSLDLEVTSISTAPEPRSAALLGMGVVGLSVLHCLRLGRKSGSP